MYWDTPEFKAARDVRLNAYLALISAAEKCPYETEAYNAYQDDVMQPLRDNLEEAYTNLAQIRAEQWAAADGAQLVHASWDGRAICTGTYGGSSVSPKHDPQRVTCPQCGQIVARST